MSWNKKVPRHLGYRIRVYEIAWNSPGHHLHNDLGMFSRCAWAPLVGALRAHWTDWTDWTGQTGWTGWTGRSGLDGLDWTDWKVMLVCIHACVYTQALYMFPTHTTCMFPIHAMKLFILDSE